MPIYQKGTNFTKVKDIYLCTGASDFTRICKVYLCTAANTFELVYDGCAVECDCETYCSFCDTADAYLCLHHATSKTTAGIQRDCNCNDQSDPEFGVIYSCQNDNPPCTFTSGCYYNNSVDCGGGLFGTCYEPCCAIEPKNCPAWSDLENNDPCCYSDPFGVLNANLECP